MVNFSKKFLVVGCYCYGKIAKNISNFITPLLGLIYVFVEFLSLFTFHFLYGQPFDPDKCYKLAMHNFLLMKYPKILWLHWDPILHLKYCTKLSFIVSMKVYLTYYRSFSSKNIQWCKSKDYIFWIFILHNNVSIRSTLLLQNFIRKLIKLIS